MDGTSTFQDSIGEHFDISEGANAVLINGEYGDKARANAYSKALKEFGANGERRDFSQKTRNELAHWLSYSKQCAISPETVDAVTFAKEFGTAFSVDMKKLA